MSLNTDQVLALGSPTIIFLFSMIFVGVWAMSGRSRHYLLLFATTFCLFGIAVTLRILRLPSAPGSSAMITTILGLTSAILMAKGAAARYRITLNTTLLASLAAILLAAASYLEYVQHDLAQRIHLLNLGTVVLLSSVIPHWWRIPAQRSVDRLLFWVYAMFTIGFIPRALLFTTSNVPAYVWEFAHSPFWISVQLMLFLSMIVLALAILSAAIVDLIEDLQKERNLDSLTQLHNRRSFEERSLTAVKERRYRAISLMMCDIDFFKSINDTYGHSAGDQVLQAVGRILLECCRTEDVAARVGGEEFAVLLPDTTLEGATQFADRVRNNLAQTLFTVKSLSDASNVTQSVTASFGVAQRRRNESMKDLLSRADAMLYAAKSNGRNNVTIAGQVQMPQSHHHCHSH